MINIVNNELLGTLDNKNEKGDEDTKVDFYFTSDDIISLTDYFNGSLQSASLQGLVQFFDGRLGINRIVELLKNVIDGGIKIIPNVLFHPVTEKCELKDGVFYITKQPYAMGESIFVNSLIMCKLEDGTYVFHDSVNFFSNELKCVLTDNSLNGFATVTYFVLDTETINNLS